MSIKWNPVILSCPQEQLCEPVCLWHSFTSFIYLTFIYFIHLFMSLCWSLTLFIACSDCDRPTSDGVQQAESYVFALLVVIVAEGNVQAAAGSFYRNGSISPFSVFMQRCSDEAIQHSFSWLLRVLNRGDGFLKHVCRGIAELVLCCYPD